MRLPGAARHGPIELGGLQRPPGQLPLAYQHFSLECQELQPAGLDSRFVPGLQVVSVMTDIGSLNRCLICEDVGLRSA